MKVIGKILKIKNTNMFIFIIIVSILTALIDKYVVEGTLKLFIYEIIGVFIYSLPIWLSKLFKRYGFFFTYMPISLVLFIGHVLNSIININSLREDTFYEGTNLGSLGPTVINGLLSIAVYLFGLLFILSCFVELIRVLVLHIKSKLVGVSK